MYHIYLGLLPLYFNIWVSFRQTWCLIFVSWNILFSLQSTMQMTARGQTSFILAVSFSFRLIGEKMVILLCCIWMGDIPPSSLRGKTTNEYIFIHQDRYADSIREGHYAFTLRISSPLASNAWIFMHKWSGKTGMLWKSEYCSWKDVKQHSCP